jgi:protocatechuate 3,4-dioxygenase beta subunit
VLDESDRSPAQGAVVHASGGPRALRATTDGDGRFEIVGVSGRRVTLLVRGGGWAGASDPAGSGPGFDGHSLTPGQPLEVELLAVRGAALEGRVIDEVGAGVAGVRLRVHAVSVREHQIAGFWFAGDDGVLSDQDGRFVIPDLPPGAAVELGVMASATTNESSRGHIVGGPPVEIRLGTQRTVDVTAVFEDDGSPVVGAEVHVTAHSAGGTYGTGGERTDAKGRARLTAPRPGRLTVRLRSDALARSQPEVDVEGSDGGARELRVTVRATRGLELRGRVLLPDGRPAERVTVRATAPSNDHWSWDARTDREGRFVLRGAGTDDVELKVNEIVAERVLRGQGRFRAGAGEIELRVSDVSEEFLTFELRVLDPQGKPVPSARVQALFADRGADSAEVMRGEGRWTTPRGSALEKALEAGTLLLEASGARSEDGEPLPYGPVRVGPLKPDERKVVLRMPPERALEGRVLDPEGKGVAGVEVVAEREVERRGQGFGSPEARTDAQGRFRIGGLGEEGWRLVLRSTGDFLTPEPEVFVPGGPAIEFRLERGRNVRVRVLAPDGSVVTAALVRAGPRLPSRTRDPMEMHRAMEESRRAERVSSSGPDGAALLRGLDPTRAWDLMVTPPSNRADLRPASLPAWSPADTDVTLEAALSISGFVRDPGGAPLSGALVYAQESGGGYRGWPVDRQGAFLVTGVAKGEQVRLWAVASQGQHPDMQSAPLATAPAGSTGVVLVVDPGAALRVELVGFSPGDARTHPRILKVGRDGKLTHAFVGQPTAEGSALRYGGFLPSVSLTVWVGPDAQGRYGLARDVRAGGPVVRVEAQQGGSIRGTLRAPPGARDLSISAQQNGLQVSGDVTPQGAYEIRGLPPGRWTLHALAVTDEGYVSAQGDTDVGASLDLALARPTR